MKISGYFLLLLALFAFSVSPILAQTSEILSPEEKFWLEGRNNTIIVYPEKNNPPFSYQSAGGNIQGLSIDYIELVADKIGAKIIYLLPQSRSQILVDFASGKGDVVAGLVETNNRGATFLFTDSYVSVPTVIVVRKDAQTRKALTLNDFNGKKVSIVASSALEEYVRENYPRLIIETVTDDEVSLQQVILGEVDAAVMDIASLSFFLSKQVLSSVKVVGNTGLDYDPSFALRPTDTTLQRILEKGLAQISANERNLLTEKWVTIPAAEIGNNSAFSYFSDLDSTTLLVVVLLIVFAASIIMFRHRRFMFAHRYFGGDNSIRELKHEVNELEQINDTLLREIKTVKEEEDKLQEKINSLDNK